MIIKLFSSRFHIKDTSTAVGRSQLRHQRIAKTAISGVVARVINIATGLATVPLTLSYLGKDRFGLWMTLTGLVAFLKFTDMGFGIGLQNALSQCDGNNDRNTPKGLISSALFIMLLLFILLTGTATFIIPLIPINQLIKTQDTSTHSELLPTVQTIVIVFGFGLPCALLQYICNAYQKGYLANFYLATGRILALGGVLICISLKLSLPVLTGIVMGFPFLVLGFGSILLFNSKPWLRPSFSAVNLRDIRRIATTGISAVGAQISAGIIISGPAFVIVNRLGTSFVTPFSVTQKLLSVAGILLAVGLLPLWPAYGEAAARGDIEWVKRTFKRSIYFILVVSLPLFVVIAFAGRPIIAIWTRSSLVVPDWSLLMACNVWAVLMAWNLVCCMLLNGLDHMVGQAVYGIIFAVIAMIAGYQYGYKYGVAGVIWFVVVIGMFLRGILMGLEVAWVLHTRERQKDIG